jgi:FdhD protein
MLADTTENPLYRPEMTNAGLDASAAVIAVDEFGKTRTSYIAAERPLTIYLDKREIVTVMTLGTQPELLILGWLRNQNMISDIRDIRSIQVDWETDSVAVTTNRAVADIEERLNRRTITTGCGQGTVFGAVMDNIEKIRLPVTTIKQSTIYSLLKNLNDYNEVYKQAGAVHGCALCQHNDILRFVEDVGRHNAVDAIAGHMWLNRTDGNDKIFYTTGRLTSEMVIKVAQMGIPVLLSRSGVTQMGRELARKVGVTLIARAKGRHFLVYNGTEFIEFDAISPTGTGAEVHTLGN